MKERCPESNPICAALLTGYQLCFDEYSSRWGGGAATIVKNKTKLKNQVPNGLVASGLVTGGLVAGGLYQLTEKDEKKLDGFEKVPMVYKKITIYIKGYPKNSIFTYIKPLKYNLAPSTIYLTKIVQGYLDFGLDFCYLNEVLVRSGYVGNAVFLEKDAIASLKFLKQPNFRLPSLHKTKNAKTTNGEIFYYDNQKNSLLYVLNELDKYYSSKFTRKIALFTTNKVKTTIAAWHYEKK